MVKDAGLDTHLVTRNKKFAYSKCVLSHCLCNLRGYKNMNMSENSVTRKHRWIVWTLCTLGQRSYFMLCVVIIVIKDVGSHQFVL